MTTFFQRLGNLGILLLAGALLLGGLAGAAVAHHYDTLSAATVASHQHEDKPDQAKHAKKPGKQKSSSKDNQKEQQGNHTD